MIENWNLVGMIVWKYDESCSLGTELDPSEAFRGLNAKSGLSKLCISHPPPNRDPTPCLYPLKIFRAKIPNSKGSNTAAKADNILILLKTL